MQTGLVRNWADTEVDHRWGPPAERPTHALPEMRKSASPVIELASPIIRLDKRSYTECAAGSYNSSRATPFLRHKPTGSLIQIVAPHSGQC